MIKYLDGVIIEIEDEKYRVDETESYKNFVLKLTDPVNKFDKDNLEIDESVTDEQDRAICNNYKLFFENFLNSMDKIEKEVEKEFSDIVDVKQYD